MTTRAQAQAVRAKHEKELLAQPFVEMVGTTELDGDFAILVLLSRRPTAEEWLPTYLDGVRLVTRVTGKIQALLERNDRWRPAPGGISVGHPLITAGTLSCYLWVGGKAYLVSNAHVIADFGRARIGDEVIQPASFDNGQPPEDTIGHLSFFVPYRLDAPNKVDFALAEAIPEHVDDSILGLEPGPAVLEVFPAEAHIGQEVVKSGRSSGLTSGVVLSTDATVDVTGFPQGTLTFVDCLVVIGISQGGDSGSAVLALADGGLLGLLFAGDAEKGVYIAGKIGNMIEALRGAPGFRPSLAGAVAPARMRWVVPFLFGGILMADGIYFSRRGA